MERLLTMGSLMSLMQNEEVKNPVMQLIAYRQMSAIRINERYRLLISDGQNSNSFVVLASKLNYFISSGRLREYAIVRIKHYIIKNLIDYSKESKKCMIIIDLDVLVPGNSIGTTIGSPINFIDNSDQKVQNYPSTSVDTSSYPSNSMMHHLAQADVVYLQKHIVANNIPPFHEEREIEDFMLAIVDLTPQQNLSTIMEYEEMLTTGSLNSIMNNEEVQNPVMQIFGIKKIAPISTAVGTNERYRLNVSDGQNSYSLAVFAPHLNYIISSGKLTEFVIVCIKDLYIKKLGDQSKGSKKAIVITDLDILVPGDVVGFKIGDPKPIIDNSSQVVGNSLIASTNTFKTQSNSMISHSIQTIVDSSQTDIEGKICQDEEVVSRLIGYNFMTTEYKQMITTGSWKSMMNNKDIYESIMQVLNIEKINNTYLGETKERYRLLLSDGDNSYSFVMLASQLNHMVVTSSLNKFDIIWITDNIISNFSRSKISTKVMVVVDLVVLVSGFLVGSKIGDPKPIFNSENEINNSDPSAFLNDNHILSICFDMFSI